MKVDAANEVENRATMNSKPVLFRDAKTVVLLKEADAAFAEKKLCDGPVLNLGDTCAYSCEFCYVDSMVAKFAKKTLEAQRPQTTCGFRDVVIRRRNSLRLLHDRLVGPKGPRYKDPNDQRVVFASSLVDVAANMELLRETAAALELIFENTFWQVRLLSKSNLLPKLIEDKLVAEKHHQRIIFGVSTGTLDDAVAKAIETGTPLVSKRLKSLWWLQERGLRTYGMICPSLPQSDAAGFSRKAFEAINGNQCEHVWAEVINVRGDSLGRTLAALRKANLKDEADRLEAVSGAGHAEAWETYARDTFLGHAAVVPATKLRFLQYVTPRSVGWWRDQVDRGAVLLGKAAADASPSSPSAAVKADSKPKETVTLQAVGSTEVGSVLGLAPKEMINLQMQEETVTRAAKSSVEVARALFEIYAAKDGAYWRRQYPSFEAYCAARWGYRKAHTYRLVNAGEFLHLAKMAKVDGKGARMFGASMLPRSEAQVREVLRLPREHWLPAWQAVLAKGSPASLTAATIASRVSKYAVRKKIWSKKTVRVRRDIPNKIGRALFHLRQDSEKRPKGARIRALLTKIERLLVT